MSLQIQMHIRTNAMKEATQTLSNRILNSHTINQSNSSRVMQGIQTRLHILNSRTTHSNHSPSRIKVNHNNVVMDSTAGVITRCRRLKTNFTQVWLTCLSIFTMEKVLMSIRTIMRQSCQLLMNKNVSPNRQGKKKWMLTHLQDSSNRRSKALLELWRISYTKMPRRTVLSMRFILKHRLLIMPISRHAKTNLKRLCNWARKTTVENSKRNSMKFFLQSETILISSKTIPTSWKIFGYSFLIMWR